MTEPDKHSIRLVVDGVARGLKHVYVPRALPLPEDDEGAAFDRECRDVLDRVERAHEAMKAEESDR